MQVRVPALRIPRPLPRGTLADDVTDDALPSTPLSRLGAHLCKQLAELSADRLMLSSNLSCQQNNKHMYTYMIAKFVNAEYASSNCW